MKIDEAIKLLEIQKPVLGCKEYKKPLMYAYEMAIKALEKQIPKEVVVVDYALGETEYRCPSCSSLVSSTYCEECGQKIDWGLVD